MAEKVTIMVLKVDLECTKCYKKVKKLLCKYPQIRDQVYNEKANTVTITVVCCSPEKIRDKLCCKGRGTIKSIDIKEPEKKKKEQEKKIAEPDNKPPPPTDNKPVEKPPTDNKPVEKPPTDNKPVEKSKPKPGSPKSPGSELVPVGYWPCPADGAACCGSCYEGRPGGPCFSSGYGMPMPPPRRPCNCGCGPPRRPCNCGCGSGRSICYDNGYGRGYTMITRCDYYFSEENQAGCTVM